MRVSNNNGASFASPIRLTTNTGYSGDPSVALASPFGTYTALIAWNDDTPVSGSGVNRKSGSGSAACS